MAVYNELPVAAPTDGTSGYPPAGLTPPTTQPAAEGTERSSSGYYNELTGRNTLVTPDLTGLSVKDGLQAYDRHIAELLAHDGSALQELAAFATETDDTGVPSPEQAVAAASLSRSLYQPEPGFAQNRAPSPPIIANLDQNTIDTIKTYGSGSSWRDTPSTTAQLTTLVNGPYADRDSLRQNPELRRFVLNTDVSILTSDEASYDRFRRGAAKRLLVAETFNRLSDPDKADLPLPTSRDLEVSTSGAQPAEVSAIDASSTIKAPETPGWRRRLHRPIGRLATELTIRNIRSERIARNSDRLRLASLAITTTLSVAGGIIAARHGWNPFGAGGHVHGLRSATIAGHGMPAAEQLPGNLDFPPRPHTVPPHTSPHDTAPPKDIVVTLTPGSSVYSKLTERYGPGHGNLVHNEVAYIKHRDGLTDHDMRTLQPGDTFVIPGEKHREFVAATAPYDTPASHVPAAAPPPPSAISHEQPNDPPSIATSTPIHPTQSEDAKTAEPQNDLLTMAEKSAPFAVASGGLYAISKLRNRGRDKANSPTSDNNIEPIPGSSRPTGRHRAPGGYRAKRKFGRHALRQPKHLAV